MLSHQRTVKNLDGEEVIYTYEPLTRKTAMEVEFKALGAVTAALSEASEPILSMFQESSGKYLSFKMPGTEAGEEGGEAPMLKIPVESISAVTKAIHKAFSNIPFELLWELGTKLLNNVTIEGPTKSAVIEKLEDSDYFNDRMDEFMLAIFWGLDVSFPRLFGKAREFLTASGMSLPGATSAKDSNGA